MSEWFALYVRSRHEFVTYGELAGKGIEAFLPQVRRPRRWKDRDKLGDFPLFPGYLFVHIRPGPENFVSVLKARGAVTLISAVPGRPTPVTEEEISSLKIMVASGEQFDLAPHIREGQRVRIKAGPLKGAQGVLSKKEARYIFSVNVELLGRSLGVKVYPDDVEPF